MIYGLPLKRRRCVDRVAFDFRVERDPARRDRPRVLGDGQPQMTRRTHDDLPLLCDELLEALDRRRRRQRAPIAD
jgi:hypothetical protein